MSRRVLVICSSADGNDYKDKDNQTMMKAILGEGFIADFLTEEIGDSFPQNLPSKKGYYSMILFAGCNLLSGLFSTDQQKNEETIRELSSLLTENPRGCIIFVQSKGYVNKADPTYYDTHKLTATIDMLFRHTKNIITQGSSNGSMIEYWNRKSLIDYWNTEFKAQQTKKDKYILYTKRDKSVVQEKSLVQEDACKAILDEVREIVRTPSAPTIIMKGIKEALFNRGINARICLKGARQLNLNTRNVNALAGEEGAKQKVRVIKAALQDTGHTAGERVQEIQGMFLAAPLAPAMSAPIKTNTTRKVQPLKPLVAEPSRSLKELNIAIGRELDAQYKEQDEANPLIKNGYPGRIRPNSKRFECEAFGISLESLNADGNNSDCFIHSFLLTTCPNFRAAKVKSTKYLQYATNFRTKILPRIVDFVFAQADFVPESPEFNAEVIKADLGTASEFLSDDLIKAICYFYNISMLIIGPGNPRVSRIIYPTAQQAENYPSAYAISNAQGAHWEPMRIVGTGQYLLDPQQVECIARRYSGAAEDSENTKARERAFKELDRIKAMPKEAIEAYVGKEGNEPGQVTELFIMGDEQIIALEALKDRLVANYKAKGLAMNPRGKVSDELIEDIKDQQINVVNGDPVDMEIMAKVEAFLQPKKGGRRTRRKGRA